MGSETETETETEVKANFAIMSRLKLNLPVWISSCEEAAANLNDLGFYKEANSLEGQATAYWAVKTFLEENKV